MNRSISYFSAIIVAICLCQCHGKVNERKDELYSRFLQEKVALTIYNTPVPDNKSDFNLLLLNDAGSFGKLDLKQIIKEQVSEKSIAPVIIISFQVESKYNAVVGDGKSIAKDRNAEKFQDFMVKELIPFAKKKAGARKFNSIVFAGYGLSAIPVWDAAWDHAATYHKAGIFEPEFESKKDTTLLYRKIASSRKRPKTAYWVWTRTSLEKNKSLHLLTALIDEKVSPEMFINDKAATLEDAFIDFLKWAFPS